MILIHFLTSLQAEALDVFVVKTKKEFKRFVYSALLCKSGCDASENIST